MGTSCGGKIISTIITITNNKNQKKKFNIARL